MQAKSSRGVQQAEVAAAADALVAEGQKPTVERVRLKLGRGSPNTLGPMLDTWFEGLAARLGLAGVDSGAGVPPAARTAFDGVWLAAVAVAKAAAEGALSGERQALTEAQAAVHATRSELESDRAALLAKANGLQDSLDLVKQQLDGRNTEFARLQAELDQSRKDLALARGVVSKLTLDHDAERTRLAKLVEEQLKTNKQQQENAAASERRQLAEIDRARQSAKEAKQAAVASEKAQGTERQTLTARIEKLQNQVHELEVSLAAAQGKLAGADKRRGTLRTEPPTSVRKRLKARPG